MSPLLRYYFVKEVSWILLPLDLLEFDPATGQGNGMTFEAHQYDDLLQAIERSLRVFANHEQYQLLRNNARVSVLDNSRVAAAWKSEFCRLKQRMH